jgi:glucose/arabinose dehydrogenase
VPALLWVVAAAAVAHAQTVPSGFSQGAYGGSLSNGTAMAFAPDGRLFVCQQGGQVRVISASGSLLATPFMTLSVTGTNERGLLGLAFDPNYTVNRRLYVFYSHMNGTENRVSRFVADASNPNIVDAAVAEVVLLTIPMTSGYHNGGAIHFGLDGKLYVATGEGHTPSNAQSTASLGGKILRINPDGSIPADNPYYGTLSGNFRAIWAIGLRNPFTFAVQPGTGRMFINDVGSNTSDTPHPSGVPQEEINEGIAGANYGWNNAEGVMSCGTYQCPVYAYPRSGGACAITGGTFYNPSTATFPAAYVGQYFFSDYCGSWIQVLNPASATASSFGTGFLSCVDLDVGPDGALYALCRGGTAGVRRIAYTGGASQNIIVSADAVTVNEGSSSTFGVKLAVDPGTGVTVQVDLATALGNAPLTLSASPLSFTGGGAGTWNTYQTVTVTAPQENPDADDGGVSVTLASAGLATQTVAVTVLDDDRPAGTPSARITLPRQGQVVGGTNAEFFGEGLDNSGTSRAEFYVDGVLLSTDNGTSGHYHAGGGHASWNTTGLSNGIHVLRMVVFDDSTPTALSGAHQISVFVNNVLSSGGSSGGGGCGLTGLELGFLLLWALRRRRRR